MAKQEEPNGDRSRKAEELALARKIMDAFRRKADEIAQSRSNGGSSDQFRLGPAERQALLEINNNMVEGVAAGLVSLFVLRRIRAALWRRLYGQHNNHHHQPPQQHQQQAHAPPPPPPSSSPNAFQSNSPFHRPPSSPFGSSSSLSSTPRPPPMPLATSPPPHGGVRRRQGPFAFVLAWMLDLMGAGAVMVTVSFVRTDLDQILDRLATLPLVPGRSVVAREFCPDVVRALDGVRRRRGADDDDDDDDDHHHRRGDIDDDIDDDTSSSRERHLLEHAQTKQLQAFWQFAQNCRRRAAYERRLRRDLGSPPDDRHFVEVPPPGVPPDYPMERRRGGGGDGDDDDDDDDFFYPQPPEEGTEQWADDFTTDRKEK